MPRWVQHGAYPNKSYTIESSENAFHFETIVHVIETLWPSEFECILSIDGIRSSFGEMRSLICRSRSGAKISIFLQVPGTDHRGSRDVQTFVDREDSQQDIV